jgi:hypothetical protein
VSWLVSWAIVAIVGIAGTVASFNSVRFSRRVARETREIAGGVEPAPPTLDRSDLPAPVACYINKAINRSDPIRTVSLRHGGRFRTSLNGAWLPIRGTQFFRTSPPAFIWWGTFLWRLDFGSMRGIDRSTERGKCWSASNRL